MRLWELEGGDGQDVGIGYGGGNALDIPEEVFDVEAIEEAERNIVGDRPAVDNEVAANGGRREREQQHRPLERAQVAREGPLVLRIGGGAPVIRGPAEGGIVAPAPAPAAALGQGRRQQGGRGDAALGRGGNAGRGRGVDRGNRGNRGRGGVGAANRQQPGGNGGERRGRGGRHARNQPQPAVERPVAVRHDPQMEIGNILRQEGELDANQQAWIRQFVQLALNDQEDLVEWDSDDDL